MFFFFFSSRRRHTRYWRDWSSDVCSSDLAMSDLFKSTFKSLAPNTAVIYFEPTEMENLSAGLMQPFAKSDLQAVQSVGGVESAEAYNKAIISAPGTRDDAFYGEAKYFGKSSSISVVEGLSMRYKITKGRSIKY